MTDKHTPGRWQIVYLPTGTGNSQWRVLDADAHPVASSDVGPHAYNEANGRLIAAAPELLEALEAVLPLAKAYNSSLKVGDGYDGDLLPDAPLNLARTAIQAAKVGG